MLERAIVYTDIEGSTRRWAERPVAMADALARHDAIVRAVVTHTAGEVVNTAGDSFVLAFAHVDHAVAFASICQRELHATDFSEVEGVRVRMGIHVGQVVPRDGDYFGPTMNLGGRLHAAAHGGQTIVTDAVIQAVGELPAGCSFRRLGMALFKDVVDPMAIHQLSIDGLPDDFPPLRGIRSLGNFRPRNIELVGRESDVDELTALIDDARLVTVTGMAGVGKTALVDSVAAQLAPSLTGGVWWCDLRNADELGVALQLILGALRAGPGESDLLTAVVDLIGDRRLVLVLDGADACGPALAPLLDSLRSQCPSAIVVTTCRSLIGHSHERYLSLRPLRTDAARALFRRESAVTGAVADHDDAVVDEITEAFARLPLGIELAVSRTRRSTILAVLEETRAATATHASANPVADALRPTLASIDHIASVVMANAVCFPTWFGFDDLLASLHEHLDPIVVSATVDDLVRRALIVEDATRRPAELRVLAPVRSEARVVLSSIDWSATEDAHRHWLVAEARRLAEALDRGAEVDRHVVDRWLDELPVALPSADATAALQLLSPLPFVVYPRALYRVRPWTETVLARPGAQELEHAQVVAAVGAWIARSQGDLEVAHSLLDLPEVDTPTHPMVLLVRGWLAFIDHDIAMADTGFNTAVQRAQDLGSSSWRAMALQQNALRSQYIGRNAVAMARAAVIIADGSGNSVTRGFGRFVLGECLAADDPDGALGVWREAIELADAFGHDHLRAITTVATAALWSRRGDGRAAASGLLDGLAFARSAGTRTVILPIIENASALLARTGHDATAITMNEYLSRQRGSALTADQATDLRGAAERLGSAEISAREIGRLLELNEIVALTVDALGSMS
jgi:class 3 adenylate cyclase